MNIGVDDQFVKELNAHAGILHRICRIYFANTDDRKDVFQEMVYQLWKSYPSFQRQSKFSTWMYKVALNTAITGKRREQRSIKSESLSDALINLGATNDQEHEQMNLLYQAIEQLGLVDRAIILLHLDENSYEEIAQITGLTKVNVSVRLVRIKKKLEELLKR